jgi:hypothetical protein
MNARETGINKVQALGLSIIKLTLNVGEHWEPNETSYEHHVATETRAVRICTSCAFGATYEYRHSCFFLLLEQPVARSY